jgi:hypothetical protein
MGQNSQMKRRLTEESVLFASVVKWFLLATATGAVVGVSTTVFLKALTWGISLASRTPSSSCPWRSSSAWHS